MFHYLFCLEYGIINFKKYNQIKTYYKIILINVKIIYLIVSLIIHKRPVITLFIRPEIKLFYLIIHKMYSLLI